MPKFGPGTFTVGNGTAPLEVSCLVNSLTISADKDQGDSTTKLCGTVRPGAVNYTYSLSGNVDIDSDDAQGLFALSQEAKGTQLPFTFTPANGGTEASGVVIIDPLDFGGDEFGADMTSDIEWDLVGEPEYDFQGTRAAGVNAKSTTANWWENLVLAGDNVLPLAPVGPAVVPVPAPAAATSSKSSSSTSTDSAAA
ncbi:MAG: hypothetical protein FWF90_16250 [Promicromonosporaceae bacterium]|nr:hypothetical protein [Promicromonosporaceae bacterium]